MTSENNETLYFHGKRGRPVPVDPPSLALCAREIPGCAEARFIQRSPESLEIRYRSAVPEERDRVGRDLLERTRNNFSTWGAGNVAITLSDEAPAAEEGNANIPVPAPE